MTKIRMNQDKEVVWMVEFVCHCGGKLFGTFKKWKYSCNCGQEYYIEPKRINNIEGDEPDGL